MDVIKSCSRRILIWMLILFTFVALMVIAAGVAAWQFLFSALPIHLFYDAAARNPEFQAGFDQIQPWIDYAARFFIPAIGGTCFLLAMIFGLILRRSVKKAIARSGVTIAEKTDRSPMKSERKKKAARSEDVGAWEDDGTEPLESEADRQARMQRLYLHLLTVFQREGRLVDFFTEDLTPYDDAQIGVAVRNIHENCGNTLQKYLKPKAVIDKQEGEEILVPKNFDVDAIKLTGNVAGEPPFKGILRHKGWQAGRIELPVLNPGHNPRVISPAEVEIV